MLLFMRAGRILDNYESFDLVSEWTVFVSFFLNPQKIIQYKLESLHFLWQSSHE